MGDFKLTIAIIVKNMASESEQKSMGFLGWLLRVTMVVGLTGMVFFAGVSTGWAIWAEQKVITTTTAETTTVMFTTTPLTIETTNPKFTTRETMSSTSSTLAKTTTAMPDVSTSTVKMPLTTAASTTAVTETDHTTE